MARKKNGIIAEIDDQLDRNRRLIEALRNLNEKICCEGKKPADVQEYVAETDIAAGTEGAGEESN